MRRLKIAGIAVTVIVLTLLTQIGGVALLAAVAARRALGLPQRLVATLSLLVMFYAATSLAASFVAPLFGRVALPCFASQQSKLVIRSPMLCALNRHYVVPQLKLAALALAADMDRQFPGTTTLALDGNFPFLNGFPLLPHLSHADGRKLDIAFYYADVQGGFRNGQTPSPLGYFAFEPPQSGATLPCAGRHDLLTARWDLDVLQVMRAGWRLEEDRTRAALQWLITQGPAHGVDKVFVEPHIAERLGVSGNLIRFQGCRAARHDDHIHIQVPP